MDAAAGAARASGRGRRRFGTGFVGSGLGVFGPGAGVGAIRSGLSRFAAAVRVHRAASPSPSARPLPAAATTLGWLKLLLLARLWTGPGGFALPSWRQAFMVFSSTAVWASTSAFPFGRRRKVTILRVGKTRAAPF